MFYPFTLSSPHGWFNGNKMTCDASPKFIFRIGSQEYLPFNFTLNNWGVSREYNIDIRLLNPDVSPMLLESAYLNVDGFYFHGYISEIEESYSDQIHELKLQLSSPLSHFLQCNKTRVYSRQTIKQVIHALLTESGLTEGIDFDLQLTREIETVFLQQDNQSSLDFLQQLLAMYGIFYHYQQDEYGARCIITDSLQKILPKEHTVTLSCTPPSGLQQSDEVALFASSARLIPHVTKSCVFNPNNAACTIEQTHSEHPYARGKLTISGKNAARISKSIQASLDETAEQHIVRLNSIMALPGQSVMLVHPALLEKNHHVSVIHIKGENQTALGSQKTKEQTDLHHTRLQATLTLSSTFSGLPVIDQNKLQPYTKLQTANIEHRNGKYPDLSSKGEYCLRLHLDESQDSPNQYHSKTHASPWVRSALYFTGNHYGFSHPFHDGSEVLVGFENGNTQAPIILGALPNQTNPSVVRRANRKDNIIASCSGHYLNMKAHEDKRTIELATANQYNRFFLQQDHSLPCFELDSLRGKIKLDALSSIQFTTLKQHQQVSKYAQAFWAEGFFKLNLKQGSLNVYSNETISLNSAQLTLLNSQKQSWYAKSNLLLKTKKALSMSTNRLLTLSCKHGDCAWHAVQGKIYLKAKYSLNLKGGSSQLCLAPSTVRMTTSGLITIKASSIIGLEALEAV